MTWLGITKPEKAAPRPRNQALAGRFFVWCRSLLLFVGQTSRNSRFGPSRPLTGKQVAGGAARRRGGRRPQGVGGQHAPRSGAARRRRAGRLVVLSWPWFRHWPSRAGHEVPALGDLFNPLGSEIWGCRVGARSAGVGRRPEEPAGRSPKRRCVKEYIS